MKESEVINWLNDPLLLDDTPTPMNEWITANKILSTEYQVDKSFIDLDTLTLRLFPILVRKIDFVQKKASDRILSRFPFIVLTDEERELIKEKILLIAHFSRDYFYKSITDSIMTWKRRITTYLKRGAIPYPLYRCACEVLEIPLIASGIDKLYFESARGKKYCLPTKLTNAIVYLCGVCNGDGHLKRHWLRITDETREHMVLLSKLFEQEFNDTSEIFETGNAWNVELRCEAVVRLINFLTDQTINGPKYDALCEPLLFKQLGSPYRNIYWRGAMDADGSFLNQITFSSTSEQYILDFQQFLESIGISSTLKIENNVPTGLYLPAKDKLKYVEHIGSLNPKKSEDLLAFVQRRRTYANYSGFKKNVLTNEGYFNLDLLDALFILNLGDLLKDFRANRSFKEMDEYFELYPGSYSAMEKNHRGIPYTILKRVCAESNKSLYSFLQENLSDARFHVTNSKPMKLPIKPFKELENLLAFFEPKLRYVSVIDDDKFIKQKITDIFDITYTNARIVNRMLVHFLLTFFDYTENTPIISVRRFFEFKKKWRTEIFP